MIVERVFHLHVIYQFFSIWLIVKQTFYDTIVGSKHFSNDCVTIYIMKQRSEYLITGNGERFYNWLYYEGLINISLIEKYHHRFQHIFKTHLFWWCKLNTVKWIYHITKRITTCRYHCDRINRKGLTIMRTNTKLTVTSLNKCK